MRLDVEDLARFPAQGGLEINIDLIKRLSPDSLSVMEFKSELDVRIAEKMLEHPLLGERLTGTWNLELGREFHMTDDSGLFKTSSGKGRVPLYEGKMIWQFDHRLAAARYWVEEKAGVAAVTGTMTRRIKHCLTTHLGQVSREELDVLVSRVKWDPDCKSYRLAFRDIAASTNERTLICTVLPPMVFAGNTLNLSIPTRFETKDRGCKQVVCSTLQQTLFLCSALNSFVVDWLIRQKVTSHLNMFYVYQVPVPRSGGEYEAQLALRAAKLICTTSEFDRLALDVGLTSHEDGVTDESGRARLRAEIDGLGAHLYGLTEEEFAHILATFPLVPDPVKVAARNAYRDVAKGLLQ